VGIAVTTVQLKSRMRKLVWRCLRQVRQCHGKLQCCLSHLKCSGSRPPLPPSRACTKPTLSGEQVKADLLEELNIVLNARGIVVEDVPLRSITLPARLGESIERKLQMEQACSHLVQGVPHP